MIVLRVFLLLWLRALHKRSSFIASFSLVAEVFNYLCLKAESVGFFMRFHPFHAKCFVPLLRYVDDTLVFCRASLEEVTVSLLSWGVLRLSMG